MSPIRTKLIKGCLYLGSACVLASGIIGVLHLPFAKGALQRIGGCPVSNAAEVQAAQRANLLREKSDVAATTVAPTRMVLGFLLGETSYDSVIAWSDKHELKCESKREASWVKCKAVPTASLSGVARNGAIDELSFTFDITGRKLQSVSAYRFRMPIAQAQKYSDEVRAYAKATLGTPKVDVGEWQLPKEGTYLTASMSYRFSDVTADVSVTCLPQGASVREVYGIYPDVPQEPQASTK
jgi:hypothetical protein